MLERIRQSALRFLKAYYFAFEHPMKLRLWYGMLRMLGYPKIIIPFAENGRLQIDTRDCVDLYIFLHGIYEPEVWEALAACVESNEVFWDIGAYKGIFSVLAAHNPGVKEVHAFEPSPMNFQALQTNISLNAKDKTSVYNFALGDKREKRKFFPGPLDNPGMSSFMPRAQEAFYADCYSADWLVFDKGLSAPSLMKVDIEGWELYFFKGAERLFLERPPRALVFEARCNEGGEIIDHTITDYLEKFGYRIRRIKRPRDIILERENFFASRL